MFQTTLEHAVIRYTDSPLLRAATHGRVLVVDEADKAPEHVVAIFRSLAGQGELTLSDGRRLTRVVEREGDLPIHPTFRLILLANRPGYRTWPLPFNMERCQTDGDVFQLSLGTISCRFWGIISAGE